MTKSSEKLVEINHLKKYFKVGKGFLHAVDDGRMCRWFSRTRMLL